MSDATLTVQGLTRNSKTPRQRMSWVARGTIVLGVLFMATTALGVLVWMRSEARASEAVQAIVADAREYRETQRAEAAAVVKKKGRKSKGKATPAAAAASFADPEAPVEQVRDENETLKSRLDGYVPKGVYIIVDTANNRFYMKDGQNVLLDTKCSTGSYSKLDAPDGRSWFFHTPRGQFKVRGKITNPIWVKPDWAYWEDNKKPPKANDPDRYDPNVMGEYALPFGNGYFIHGTLYNRLLGQSVTHGCIRLDDAPLEQVYKTASVGTPIFIY